MGSQNIVLDTTLTFRFADKEVRCDQLMLFVFDIQKLSQSIKLTLRYLKAARPSFSAFKGYIRVKTI